MRGCLDVAVIPSGLVRKASTSNLLSLLMNVNDSTSAICFPAKSCAFKSVNLLFPARKLTELNPQLFAGKQISEVDSLTFLSNDDKFNMEAFLSQPLDI